MIQHPRSAEHYARVERERIPGETFTNAIARIAVEDAIATFGSAREAAKFLGMTREGALWYVRRSRARRVNAELGRPEDNRRGPSPGHKWTAAQHSARRGRDDRAVELSLIQEGS